MKPVENAGSWLVWVKMDLRDKKHVRTLGNDKPILYLPKKLVKKIGKKIKGNLVKIQ